LTFIGVGFYPPMGEHEAQKLPSLNPECTLPGVKLHIDPSEGLEHLIEVLQMLFERVGLHDYVVHIYLYRLTD